MNINPNFDSTNELYEFKCLRIYYGDDNKNDLSETINIPIDFSKNLILGSTKFLNIITKEFNNFFKDKCKSNELRGIITFSCDKDTLYLEAAFKRNILVFLIEFILKFFDFVFSLLFGKYLILHCRN